MNPVYVDVHIHTSDNPDSLNLNYDVDTLFANIRKQAQGLHALISLTDHNVINKQAYLQALSKRGEDIHLLLGVELHVHYIKETEAYHCHIFFKNDITADIIDTINDILLKLYPQKQVKKSDKSIPTLDQIIYEFEGFDFVLLPHGGQSHATFNKAIPSGRRFDTMMERSVYYNQFDGFTARSETGREETDEYFKKLGINAFVNLVTCSDNYEPSRYPEAKSTDAEPLIPTWMFSEPTFEGFRLSLSEKSRIIYGKDKPESWSENIESVKYKNEYLDIDVEFSSGLNVVIGGSSSGKTLLVDSVNRKLTDNNFEDSDYRDFGVENIQLDNPSGLHPHYLSQNYIMKVVGNDTENHIEDIDIVKNLFPNDRELTARINASLNKLDEDMSEMMQAVKEIELIEASLRSISQVGRLFVMSEVKKNIISGLVPSEDTRNSISYSKSKNEAHIKHLTEIKELLAKNPFVPERNSNIDEIIGLLKEAAQYSEMEELVYQQISQAKSEYGELLKSESLEDQTKSQQFDELLKKITEYVVLTRKFKKHLDSIASYDEKVDTKEIVSSGHRLYISNQFQLNKNIVLEVFNQMLKTGRKIDRFEDVTPDKLFEDNYFKKNPKVVDYDDFKARVCGKLQENNHTVYRITTNENKDFDKLSAGWKTSVLLDLILGYDKDIAPIIIDQPEDNLATNYINDGLVEAIKKVKGKKQIILVSHNATIPMMGDAQRIIYCENKEGVITIRSSSLEGEINGAPVLDLIAKITDGGKPSIKKRVKKYNLKKFT